MKYNIKYNKDDNFFVVFYYSLKEPDIFDIWEIDKAIKRVEKKEYPILRGFKTFNEAKKFKEMYWNAWKKGDVIQYTLLPEGLEELKKSYNIK